MNRFNSLLILLLIPYFSVSQSKKIRIKFTYCKDTLNLINKSKHVFLSAFDHEQKIKLNPNTIIIINTFSDSIKFTIKGNSVNIESAIIPYSFFKSKSAEIHFLSFTDFFFFKENYDNETEIGTKLLNCACLQDLIFKNTKSMKDLLKIKPLDCSVAVINSDLHSVFILYNYHPR